jgi:hypothetical protein
VNFPFICSKIPAAPALWNICDINDHGYVPLVVSTSQSFPHSRLITGLVTKKKCNRTNNDLQNIY